VINFRYHVVSLAAVFIALAIGLVVGTAAFNGPAADALDDQVAAMRSDNNKLRDEVEHLTEEAQQEERFATEALPGLIGNRLAGKRVLLVTTTDAGKDYIDGVADALETVAGAKITGRLSIQKKFVDPANKEELLDLVATITPPGVTGLPANSNGVETASALLATTLMDRDPAMDPLDRRKVLTAFKEQAYLISPDVTGPAEAVVVLAGAPYTEKDADKLNGALKAFVEQFDKTSPIVVAGESTAGAGNLVGTVRGDGALSKPVSTVDNAGSPQGRAAVLLALAEQIEGKSGHYGVASGSTSLLPKTVVGARNGS
jgi:copper transport outer membrane protein MctB